MARRRETSVFNIAFLDLLSGALGAVIILYITVPKSKTIDPSKAPIAKPVAIFNEVKKKTPDKQNDFEAYLNELEEIQKKISEMSGENKKLKEKNQFLAQENEKLVAKEVKRKIASKSSELASVEKRVTAALQNKKGVPVDVGFNFKGKEILFIIDVSGSMVHEDRVGQVKAGLKMLITSMSSDFKVNVIFYPDGVRADYKKLWSYTKQTNQRNKSEIYKFLYKLKPYGSTPTRTVLKHAMANYSKATDIVLLSDGAPTFRNSKKLDDISGILYEVRKNNELRNVQINTVGVGSDFLSNKSNPAYRFLKDLAEQNNGFFYGF